MSSTFTEFLNLVELRGATWCLVDMGTTTGFTVHQNDTLFFYIALEGSARIAAISGGTLDLTQGSCALILSGEAHAVRNHADARTEVIEYLRDGEYNDAAVHISLGTRGAAATRLLCGRLKVRWPSGIARKSLPARAVLSADAMIVSPKAIEEATTGPGASAMLTRIASLFLTYALRRDPRCEHLFTSSAANDPVARAMQLIDRHYNLAWTVVDLASNVGMGRSNFAARFASEIGRTPMKALAERRMRAAAELLQSGELKIAEIAAHVGYASEAAFARCFGETFGTTPGQMRSRHKRPAQLHPAPATDDPLVAPDRPTVVGIGGLEDRQVRAAERNRPRGEIHG
jgi:AraC-like DNA-binding protein/mannose-6-phosphate isomerase-like protein (cupin superfamily)